METLPHVVAERVAYWTGRPLPLNIHWAQATCGRPKSICRALIREYGGSKALALAVDHKGPMECIKIILAWCPESVRLCGRRPLRTAFRKGYFSIAQVLAEATPAPLLRLDRDVLLGYSLRHGDHPAAVQLLRTMLDRGVCFETVYDGGAILHAAIKKNYVDLVSVLLDGGLPFSMPFISLCDAQPGSVDMLVLLHKHGAPIRGGNDLLLQMAAWDGHANVVNYLLHEHSADPNANHHTPLIKAVSAGHIHIVDILVDAGADLHFKDEAVIFIAARHRNLHMLAYLVDIQGCDPKARNGELLHSAIWTNWPLGVHFALSRDIPVDLENQTPLCTAVNMGFTEITEILLGYGADPNARDGLPLRSARRRADVKLMEILIGAGAIRPTKKVRFELNLDHCIVNLH